MNILLCDGLDNDAIQQLQGAGHTVVVKKGITKEELHELLPIADVVVVRSATKITRDVLAHAPNLKLAVRAGVGLDNIDAVAAKERGVVVKNTPAATAISVAEHTLGLMLSLARHIPAAHMSMNNGEWNRKGFEGTELCGKTLGVVGLGRIGREVCKRAKAFHMNIIACEPNINQEVVDALEIEAAPLEDVVERADYLTLHLPVTPETRGLISASLIARMKRTAYVVNTARGELIDEAALAGALRESRIAGAALDVYSAEPPPANHPLLKLPNVIHVPHLGASTVEGQRRAGLEVAQIILEFAGK